ncbi:MAG TPA: prolipoprotein diacylglyceryl transferase [Mycobacterium sp.]|nr:prolipoprotein diacylglyceryl transferase [Mycobacterium sp.]
MTMLPTYFPSPPRGVWHLWIFPIRAYALFIIIGIVAALVIGDRRWVARGGQRGVIYDIALWAVPFGLVGGRLYHLATDWRTYWGPGGAGFWAALRIWDGGLGIWGAVALGGVGAWIGCRRRGIPLPAFGDAIAPGIILAQAIGRLGNYFNQELYGRETTVPWGLEIFYRRDPSGYIDPHSLDGVSTGQVAYVVQPTFLYELIWNLLVFVVLIYVDRRFKLGHGRLFALYVAGYCVGRFGVELMRDDTATHIAGIRINVFTSTFVFIGAVVYIILAPKGREDPASLRGNHVAEEPPESKPVSEPADEPATVARVGAGTAAKAATGGKDDEPADSAKTDESAEAPEAETAEPETVEAETGVAKADAEEPKAEEPESAEPEAVEPEAVKPEVLEPEVLEPEAAASEDAEPEVAGSEDVEGEAAEPEVAEAEEAEAEEAEAEDAEPEVAEADQAEAEDAEPEDTEAEEAEAVEPEAEEPDVEPETADAEVAEPEADETDGAEAAEPEADETDGAEAAEREADEPEADEPEAEEPKAESGSEDGPEPEPEAKPAADTEKAVEQTPSADVTAASGTAGSALRRLSVRLRNRRPR